MSAGYNALGQAAAERLARDLGEAGADPQVVVVLAVHGDSTAQFHGVTPDDDLSDDEARDVVGMVLADALGAYADLSGFAAQVIEVPNSQIGRPQG